MALRTASSFAFFFSAIVIFLMCVLFFLAGCSGVLSEVTADIHYSPSAKPVKQTKNSLYMHAADERRSTAVAQHLGFVKPILNNVHLTIGPPEAAQPALATPLQAVQLALGARLKAMGYPVSSGAQSRADAREFVVYLYEFAADFSRQDFCVATVTLALGAVPVGTDTEGKTLAPEGAQASNNAIYVPICAQSSGLGTAPILPGDHKAAAEDALHQALAQAVDSLAVEVCLK